jgi:ribosomal protein L16 Arg81 hydroxylase
MTEVDSVNESDIKLSFSTMKQPLLTISRLIRPLTLDLFLSDYWEKKPHCSDVSDDPVFQLLSLDDIEYLITALYSLNYHPNDIKMSHCGQNIDFSEFTRPSNGKILVEPEKIFMLFRKGATIILNRINRVEPQIRLICRDLQLFFGVLVQANAYFTPPRSQGFGTHFDGHDVFILQMFGEKVWKVYDCTFPYATEESASLQDRGRKPTTKVVIEHILREGEILYVPRGFPHEAITQDIPSFHVTIGVYPNTWADVLRDIILNSITNLPVLRQSLMPRFYPRSEDLSPFRAKLSEIVEAVFTDENFRNALEWRYDRERNNMEPVLNGYLTDIVRSSQLGDSERVSIRTTVALTWEESDSALILSFHQKRIELPVYLKPAIERILDTNPFSPAELPGDFSQDSKVLLVKRLLEEGLLQFSHE